MLLMFLVSENISGCLDINACNYNVNANPDDGSCRSHKIYDCDGSLVKLTVMEIVVVLH